MERVLVLLKPPGSTARAALAPLVRVRVGVRVGFRVRARARVRIRVRVKGDN